MLSRSLWALAACAFLSTGCGETSDAGPPRPNVVFLVVDTLRADYLPFYGYPRDTAPFLTSLAERGVLFERAWSTSSWTAPSTASIFTGLYPVQHGVTQGIMLTRELQDEVDASIELNRVPAARETLPEAMARIGYRTFGLADNPNICPEMGFADGFERFEGFGDEGSDHLNARLADWLPEIAQSEPWFVYLHYMDPHAPYERRAPYFDVHATPRDPQAPVGAHLVRAAYDSEIRALDDNIAAAFEALGVDDETLVVFVADHGEELMQRSDRTGHPFKLYSELTRVPLVLYDPTRPSRVERVAAHVSQVDLLPTLLDILEAEPPPAPEAAGGAPLSEYAGQSIVDLYAKDQHEASQRTVYSMREKAPARGGGELRAVQRGPHKLIRLYDADGGLVSEELFDLESDWPETRNLAAERPDTLEQLGAAWSYFDAMAHLRVAGEGASVELDDEQRKLLEVLGYADDH